MAHQFLSSRLIVSPPLWGSGGSADPGGGSAPHCGMAIKDTVKAYPLPKAVAAEAPSASSAAAAPAPPEVPVAAHGSVGCRSVRPRLRSPAAPPRGQPKRAQEAGANDDADREASRRRLEPPEVASHGSAAPVTPDRPIGARRYSSPPTLQLEAIRGHIARSYAELSENQEPPAVQIEATGDLSRGEIALELREIEAGASRVLFMRNRNLLAPDPPPPASREGAGSASVPAARGEQAASSAEPGAPASVEGGDDDDRKRKQAVDAVRRAVVKHRLAAPSDIAGTLLKYIWRDAKAALLEAGEREIANEIEPMLFNNSQPGWWRASSQSWVRHSSN